MKLKMRSHSPNYDKFPYVAVPNGGGRCACGWDAIGARLAASLNGDRTVVAVECYPGTDEQAIRCELASRLDPVLTLDTRELMLPSEAIERLVEPFLGGDDPVFGFLTGRPEFLDIAITYALLNLIGVFAVLKFVRFGALGAAGEEEEAG